MSIASAMPAPEGWDVPRYAPVAFDAFRFELLKLYEFPLRAKGTRDKLRFTLDRLAELLGPAGTTADLTPALVARFIASRPPGESPHTTQGLLNCVRTACSYAVSRGYALNSPFTFRKRWLRVGRVREKKHHSRDDIRRVLELLAAEVRDSAGWERWRARRLQAIAATFAYTGLRRDEGLSLHAVDVDLENRMILLVERSRRFKTEMSAQPVPIPAALVPILADWMTHRLDRPESWDKAPPDCPFLFPGVTRKGPWKGGGPGARPVDQMKAAGERAGVRDFHFLSLRHSFATHSESWGLSPAMIQRVLRHTSVKTQVHYRHADLDNMRSAVDGIGFGSPPAPPPSPDAEGGLSS